MMGILSKEGKRRKVKKIKEIESTVRALFAANRDELNLLTYFQNRETWELLYVIPDMHPPYTLLMVALEEYHAGRPYIVNDILQKHIIPSEAFAHSKGIMFSLKQLFYFGDSTLWDKLFESNLIDKSHLLEMNYAGESVLWQLCLGAARGTNQDVKAFEDILERFKDEFDIKDFLPFVYTNEYFECCALSMLLEKPELFKRLLEKIPGFLPLNSVMCGVQDWYYRLEPYLQNLIWRRNELFSLCPDPHRVNYFTDQYLTDLNAAAVGARDAGFLRAEHALSSYFYQCAQTHMSMKGFKTARKLIEQIYPNASFFNDAMQLAAESTILEFDERAESFDEDEKKALCVEAFQFLNAMHDDEMREEAFFHLKHAYCSRGLSYQQIRLAQSNAQSNTDTDVLSSDSWSSDDDSDSRHGHGYFPSQGSDDEQPVRASQRRSQRPS